MYLLNSIFLAATQVATSSPVSELKEEIKEKANLFQEELNGFLSWAKDFGKTLIIALIVFFIGQKLIHVLLKVINKGLNRSNLDEGVTGFLDTLIKAIGYIVLFVIIAGILGLETSSLVALLGSAGLAIGLALQGSLSNFAGGVLILINKPFKVGDYIVADTNEGTVTRIDIFYTHIVTADNKNTVLPNGALSNMNVTNATKETSRRLDLIIPVAYQSDIDQVKQVLLGVCKKDDRILTEQNIEIHLHEFGSSAINMLVRVWVETENYWALKWNLQEQIKIALDHEGIIIPFNQLDVNIVTTDKK